MKNRIITIGIAMLMAAGYSSCKKEDLGTVTATTTSSAASQGKYSVSKFEVNGVDHADFYTGYTIDMMKGGLLVAQGNGRKVLGNWKRDALEAKENPMVINFGSAEPFNLLSDSWTVVNETNTAVELKGSRADGTWLLVLTKK
ncbi:MAG: hypothetical protein JWO09_2858 [Bacteroidetes bacterium]|nr:hypothetical protein [Bacteroidota bacterium]